jgi:succinate dehydrogenase/fumarate reductase flavoprotein subunit
MSDEQEQKGVSRRSFLKNTGLGIVAVGGSASVLAGCSPKKAEPTEVPAESAGEGARSWETPPDPIDESEIVETIEVDVVVVGAGMSGVSATLSAVENGANVVNIEKGAGISARGLGIGVFSSRLMREAGIELDKEDAARRWIQICGSRPKESLVWLFMNESGNAMDWFLDKADAAGLPSMLWGGYYKGPDYTEVPAYHMFFGGPLMQEGQDPAADCTNLMYEEAVELGATFYFNSPGEQLIKEGDRVVGVIAKTEEGYRRFNASKGVILATGDIGGNEEMCKAYAPSALKTNMNMYYPVGQNTGDGHKMGMWAGGALQEAPFPPMLHSQAFSMLQYHYLSVNRRGERFMNEDTWVQAKSLQTMRQPENPWAYSIFDSKWPEEVAKTVEIGGGMFWDSFRIYGTEWTPDSDQATLEASIEAGEVAWTADTLEELAEKIDVPVETFLATVERYNELAEAEEDSDYGKRSELLSTISEPPYYATKWGAAVLVVVGGLSVDTKLRVLDADQNPVPGLYAVGNCSGDVYAVDYPIQIPGNSHGRALTWGYLAGKNVME